MNFTVKVFFKLLIISICGRKNICHPLVLHWKKNYIWLRLMLIKHLLDSTYMVRIINFLAKKRSRRYEQDSNLRGKTPLDFKSNALNHSAIAADETNRRQVNYSVRYLSRTATLQILPGRYRRFRLKASFEQCQR